MPRLISLAAIAMSATAVALPVAATAQTAGANPVQQLLDCRSLADSAARLACFDRAGSGLADAGSKGDVVVVDRAAVQASRRRAFGLMATAADPFPHDPSADVDQISAPIASASQSARGKWRFVLEDGAIWDQIDSAGLDHPPHSGSTADIRKGAIGSYFIKVDGQAQLRVTRVQ